MSNTVSKFLHHNSSSSFNSCLMIAESLEVKCFISFSSLYTSNANLIVALPDAHHTDFNSVELTKDQITHFLSLDCPDAFIAYALTLCPCPPETAKPALVAVDGGILSLAKRLKEIKQEINLINGVAFEKHLLTDAQHYQLLDVEMFIDDFIAPYSYREVIQ
ncbi:hypothetical protein [Psychrobacter sp.]|uniref:hypothetical protein n=1 Tax=Psychrobacter sp. TaxID=56811 RepID=UPI003C72225F